jgi:hypothetical protein
MRNRTHSANTHLNYKSRWKARDAKLDEATRAVVRAAEDMVSAAMEAAK